MMSGEGMWHVVAWDVKLITDMASNVFWVWQACFICRYMFLRASPAYFGLPIVSHEKQEVLCGSVIYSLQKEKTVPVVCGLHWKCFVLEFSFVGYHVSIQIISFLHILAAALQSGVITCKSVVRIQE